MRAIPAKLKKQIEADPFMKKCIHYPSSDCVPRIEWEHCWIYSGRQINEAWAIVPVCTYHHRGAGLDKDFNRFVSLYRATMDDFKMYPKKPWLQQKDYLVKKFKNHEINNYLSALP